MGNLIGDIVDALAAQQDMEQVTRKVKEQVKDLCNEFPVS